MDKLSLAKIKEIIGEQHAGDFKQLEVVFSSEERVLVEAPAGYGKTTTMISRIAYLLAKGEIPNPKRILALTFSVNAALKIKRDIAEKMPLLMKEENNPVLLTEKITSTNYHGFCKSVLSKHGFLLDINLRRNINSFKAVGDNNLERIKDIYTILDINELNICKSIEETVKSGVMPNDMDVRIYLDIVKNKLLPQNIITHNSELFLTIQLFEEYPEVISFYRRLFTLIIVDEFQDTNIVAWKLIQKLIGEKTKLLFLGDPLQRIYGFIGALPDIMDLAMQNYNMKKIVLNKNYRFRDNFEMLKLDYNIRLNAASVMQNVGITGEAELPGYWGKTQAEEAMQVATAVCNLMNSQKGMKIAILCRGRNENSSVIEEKLLDKGINYFYGMFTDDDVDYINFHTVCHETFLDYFGKKRTINNIQFKKFTDKIKGVYREATGKSLSSLLKLLDALRDKVSSDYAMLSPEDKYTLILDIFENRQLRQSMEYVNCDVILATVHGAKGLEWDYVFLPDLEQWAFPVYPICILCEGKNQKCGSKCKFICTNVVQKPMLEELSVFYVGVTRAKKQVFVSASGKRANGNASRYSCFATMAGVKLVKSNV